MVKGDKCKVCGGTGNQPAPISRARCNNCHDGHMDYTTVLVYLISGVSEALRWRVFKGNAESTAQELSAILCGFKDIIGKADPDFKPGDDEAWYPVKWGGSGINKMIRTTVRMPNEVLQQIKDREQGISETINGILLGRTQRCSIGREDWCSCWALPSILEKQ